MPIAKTYGPPPSVRRQLAQVDGSQPLAQFTQTVISGNTTAKAALTTLQQGLHRSSRRDHEHHDHHRAGPARTNPGQARHVDTPGGAAGRREPRNVSCSCCPPSSC